MKITIQRGRQYELNQVPGTCQPKTPADGVTGLLRRLLAQHQMVRRPDPCAVVEQYLVQCPACDGNQWKVWRPGDAPLECHYITDARDLGIED